MFGIMTSVIYGVLGFVLRSILVKFFIFFALYFVVQEFTPFILGLAQSHLSFTHLLTNIPEALKYLFNVFRIMDGINIMLSALITRFIIRRIPVIG